MASQISNGRERRPLVLAWLAAAALLAGCGREAPKPPPPPKPEVTVMIGEARRMRRSPRSTSRKRRARRPSTSRRACPAFSTSAMYIEGSVVKAGQVLFQMDQKPFQAQVDAQKAAMQRSVASFDVAKANLARVQAAGRAECAVAEGPRRREGPVRAVGRGGRAGEGPVGGGAAQPVVHDDPLAGRRRVEPRADRRRHLPEPDKFAAHHRLGADADVDQLQRVGERDPARPRRSAQGRAAPAGRRPLRRRDRDGRRNDVSVLGAHHVRGSFVQLRDGHVPASRVRRQSGRPLASQPVRACAALRCVRPNAIVVPQRAVQQGAKGHFVWVINSGDAGGAAAGRRRRVVPRRRLDRRPRALPPAIGSSSTAACVSRRGRP